MYACMIRKIHLVHKRGFGADYYGTFDNAVDSLEQGEGLGFLCDPCVVMMKMHVPIKRKCSFNVFSGGLVGEE